MPTVTQRQNSLTLTLDGTSHECQVINLEYTAPGYAAGETVEVACPDGVVVEPGDRTDGSITGEVYADSTDEGITWVLLQAQQQQATLAYVLTFYADAASTVAFTVTGECTVGSFVLPWSKPGYARHSLGLVVQTAEYARPA